MNRKGTSLTLGITALIVLATGSFGYSQRTIESSVGFPFEVLNKEGLRGRPGIGRDLFIYVHEDNFSRENLIKLFRAIVQEKTDGHIAIVVFSNRGELLKQYRSGNAMQPSVGTTYYQPDRPVENEMQRGSEYFRAFYYRNGTGAIERFRYSPRKDRGRMVTVTLRSPDQCGKEIAYLFDSITGGYTDGVSCFLDDNPGTNLDIADDKGSTPLVWALWLLHNDIARLLIDAGADPNYFASDHSSPLVAAVDAGNVSGVRLLVGAEADVNRSDANGKTPLIGASLYCHKEIIEILIEADAKIGEKDKFGNTARDYACESDTCCREISNYLKN